MRFSNIFTALFFPYIQTWVRTLFFQVRSPLYAHFFPGSLSAHFLSIDRFRSIAHFLSIDSYCSIAHFADFQVCSSLNRSKKNLWFALGKEH
jgi:hypothetical protein